MKLSLEKKSTRLLVIVLFVAFIFTLAALLTSCSSAYAPRRHSVTDGCGMSKGMVGYGPGGYHGKNQ